MPGWWDRIDKALDFLTGVRSPTAPPPAGPSPNEAPAEPRGLVGTFEAKMAGLLVTALREAFNRDAARLEAEREQAEHERRQAQRALELELARQEAERETGRLRAVGALAVIVWLASLLFVAVHPVGSGVARTILGLAWGCLTASIAAVFLGYRRVGDRARQPAVHGNGATRWRAAEIASGLAVAGLALAAASLLASM